MRLNRSIGYVIIFCFTLLFIPTAGTSTQNWFKQGVAHLKANRLNQAIEAFTRSLELIPHDYEAYNNRGIAYSRKGQSSLAELDFSKALEFNSKFDQAFTNRGIARQKQGAYGSALLDYLAAHELNPDNKRPLQLMVWVLATCPDSRLQNGTLALKIAQALAAGRAGNEQLPLLAAAHAAAGDFESAARLQKAFLSKLYTSRTDTRFVEQQQDHLVSYQSRRLPQNEIPSSQNLSDGDTDAIMVHIKTALQRYLSATSSAADLAKKRPDEANPKSPVTGRSEPRKSPQPHKLLEENASKKPLEKKSRGKVQLSNLKQAAQKVPQSTHFPYVIVIGTFQSADKGFTAALKLHQKGYPVFTAWVAGASGSRWYQLYYGWYPDKTSADTMVAALKKRGFHSVLARLAPFSLEIQLDQHQTTLERANQRLAKMKSIGYRIDNRLMVGAYKESNLGDSVMAGQLTAAGLTYRVAQR